MAIEVGAKRLFIHAVLREMERQGLSRQELAKRLGCTPKNAAQLLDGRRSDLRLASAVKLADAVGCTLRLSLVPRLRAKGGGGMGPEGLVLEALRRRAGGLERDLVRHLARADFWPFLGEMLNFLSNRTYELCAELGPHHKPSMEESIRAAVEDLKVTLAFLRGLAGERALPAIHRKALLRQADRIGVVTEALQTELDLLPEELRQPGGPMLTRLEPGEEGGHGD